MSCGEKNQVRNNVFHLIPFQEKHRNIYKAYGLKHTWTAAGRIPMKLRSRQEEHYLSLDILLGFHAMWTRYSILEDIKVLTLLFPITGHPYWILMTTGSHYTTRQEGILFLRRWGKKNAQLNTAGIKGHGRRGCPLTSSLNHTAGVPTFPHCPPWTFSLCSSSWSPIS